MLSIVLDNIKCSVDSNNYCLRELMHTFGYGQLTISLGSQFTVDVTLILSKFSLISLTDTT